MGFPLAVQHRGFWPQHRKAVCWLLLKPPTKVHSLSETPSSFIQHVKELSSFLNLPLLHQDTLPTLNYDSSSKLNKVTWDYYSGISGEPIDASKIILTVMTQISGLDYNNRLYDSPNYGPDVKENVLTTPISLSSIGVVMMAYNDIFGNSMVIGYNHQ